ncbi:hypothetical protein GCM10020000_14850 [Streptomyces olivoverticillatus]
MLRVALVLLSSAALFAAFKVWEPLLGRGCTALAALLFGGLWITVLSGPEVMPNLWVALTSVAVVGWFLRARHDGPGRRRALLGLAATLVAVTLFRAPDAVWLALPLLAACAAVRDWRRPGTVAAVLGGLALGGVQWTIEAYVRFGGIGGRLAVSSDTEGGMGGAPGRRAAGRLPLAQRAAVVPALSHRGPGGHALAVVAAASRAPRRGLCAGPDRGDLPAGRLRALTRGALPAAARLLGPALPTALVRAVRPAGGSAWPPGRCGPRGRGGPGMPSRAC